MTGKRKAKYQLRSESKKKKGLTLPGYNNLGPFNELNTPLKKSDAAALLHDIEYGKLGKKAYWTFNQADEDFLKEIENEKDIGASIAKKVFGVKKKLAEWNLLPQDPLQSKKDKNPFLQFDLSSGKGPLTRARKKALEREKQSSQQKISDVFKKQKQNVHRENLRRNKQSVLNLQEDTQAPIHTMSGDGEGSNLQAGLKETPVDQVVDVERGLRSYQFASLPWNAIWFTEELNTTCSDLAFRMTSPYDVVCSRIVTDKNPNATAVQNEKTINSTDTVINKAMWFDFYAGMYKFYHVVSCRWKILIENLGNEPIWVHQLYCTDEVPNPGASNIDIINWPDSENHYIHPIAGYVDVNGYKHAQLSDGFQQETNTSNTNENYIAGQQINTNQSNILQLAGQYSPGDCQREIRQDAEVENWTHTNTNPLLREILLLRFKPETARYRTTDQASSAGRQIRYKYTAQLEYLVEFKELKEGLRWPITDQPLTVTINQTVTEGTKTNE